MKIRMTGQQTSRRGNPTRDDLFERMKAQQSDSLLEGKFAEAKELYLAETRLQTLEGGDTAGMLTEASGRREFWESERARRLAVGGSMLAVGSLVGSVLGVFAGVLSGHVSAGIATGSAAGVMGAFGAYLASEESNKPLLFAGVLEKKANDYSKMEKELSRQAKLSLTAGRSRPAVDRADLEKILNREIEESTGKGDIQSVAALRSSLDFLGRAGGENLAEIFRANADSEALATLVKQTQAGVRDLQFRDFSISRAVQDQAEPQLEEYLSTAQQQLAKVETQLKSMTPAERLEQPGELSLLQEARAHVLEKIRQTEEGMQAITKLKRSESRMTSVVDAFALSDAQSLLTHREDQITKELSKRQAQVEVAQLTSP